MGSAVTSLTEGKRAHDYSLKFVLDVLVAARVLTRSQSGDVLQRETQARKRVLKQVGDDKYDVSPVEIVALFQVPLAGRPGELLDQDRITELVAEAVQVPYKKIDALRLDMNLAARTISKPYATKHCLLPLEGGQGAGVPLTVAVANPFDRDLFEDLQRMVGSAIAPVLASKQDILKGIQDVYGFRRTLAAAADEFATASGSVNNFEQLVTLSAAGGRELAPEDGSIIQAVEHLLRAAFDNRASDIHIEPKRDKSFVRFRIDGVLHGVYTLPPQVHAPVVSRVKMMSRIDISERRKPQDGRIKVDRDGHEVEIRVSTLPTAFGEKVVMRIFDPESLVVDITQLGFDPLEKRHFESWIAEPHGLILVTGPTGSGKTTTLYSALKALAGPDVNVTTIEDPIEMVWENFNQVQVQPKIGLDFANALRHILRQDPDIIMVGEIRDPETAENAIQSALTGHLVLSTLHTNDSVGAVGRMLDLGVPPFLLASSLLGVMAQRLVRKVCTSCASPIELTRVQLESLKVPIPTDLGVPQFKQGVGCVKCRGTGYRGRTAVFEIFSGTPEIKSLITQKATHAALTSQGRTSGLRSLREAAVRRLYTGHTGFDEVLRMTTGEQ